MSWLNIVAIILGALVLVCVAVKLTLKRKVEDIDGLCGVHTGDSNVIASVGDEKSEEKRS